MCQLVWVFRVVLIKAEPESLCAEAVASLLLHAMDQSLRHLNTGHQGR